MGFGSATRGFALGHSPRRSPDRIRLRGLRRGRTGPACEGGRIRQGLPCGGRLDLLVERIEAVGPWRKLVEALENRRCLARRVCLGTGEASLHPAGAGPDFHFDGRDLIKVFGPRWELIIIGANQVARYLVPLARSLDYHVVVCDPRDEVLASWDLPEAELTRSMPDDLVKGRATDPRCAVVALTHDPKLDDLALMEALLSPAFYVGALGSRRSSEKRRQRLLSLEVPESAVDRLSGPVGLPIGGRSPPEIALAIAAELTAVRHGRSPTVPTRCWCAVSPGSSSHPARFSRRRC